jgi:hypothetical protein
MLRHLATLILLLSNLVAFAGGMQLLPPAIDAYAGMALFLLLSFGCVAVHEMGHAIAVRVHHATIKVISVWGFGYDFQARQWGMQKRMRGREIAGFVLYTSSAQHQLSKGDHALISAAGPAINLVTALVAIWSNHWLSNQMWQGGSVIFATLSLGMAAANLVPFDGSDGRRILNYLRKR